MRRVAQTDGRSGTVDWIECEKRRIWWRNRWDHMRTRLIVASLALAALLSDSGSALQTARSAAPRESRIQVGKASLYSREIGRGQPIIVLHGGPDFDHGYLLPDLDRLADAFRLIYYDQRGRGRSADHVQPEDVTLSIRRRGSRRGEAALPTGISRRCSGHSWGAVLALEYALRHPARVSHLILMNPAPASAHDVAVLRKAYATKNSAPIWIDRERSLASAAYKEGDPEAVAARYRLHFKPALSDPRTTRS